MTKKTYAFPSDINTGPSVADANWTANGGMELRDYFAAKAMNGELSAMEHDGYAGLALSVSDDHMLTLGKHWYRIADAMMKARAL